MQCFNAHVQSKVWEYDYKYRADRRDNSEGCKARPLLYWGMPGELVNQERSVGGL